MDAIVKRLMENHKLNESTDEIIDFVSSNSRGGINISDKTPAEVDSIMKDLGYNLDTKTRSIKKNWNLSHLYVGDAGKYELIRSQYGNLRLNNLSR